MQRHSHRLVPLAALVLALVVPSSASADHCGSDATVIPASGPPGTTFVFRTNLGAPSDLRWYRDGDLVGEVFLEWGGDVRYDITTTSGDSGPWLARAELRGNPECAAEASFTVIATPDTSTANDRPLGPLLLICLGTGLVATVVARRGAVTLR